MKIWLDENLPARLIDPLEQLGHEAEAVANGPWQGHSDPEVWRAAQDQGAFFITQDLDFSDLRLFPPGTHSGASTIPVGKRCLSGSFSFSNLRMWRIGKVAWSWQRIGKSGFVGHSNPVRAKGLQNPARGVAR